MDFYQIEAGNLSLEEAQRRTERKLASIESELSAMKQEVLIVYNHQVHCNASTHTPFGGDMCSCNAPDPRIARLEAENAVLRKEAEEQDLHIEALEKKYADCPHPKGEAYWCGCSYDKASIAGNARGLEKCAIHPQITGRALIVPSSPQVARYWVRR